MSRYVAAIDQGTSSSRCLLFDRDGAVAGAAQREHAQLHPQRRLGRARPAEIVANVRAVIDEAVAAAGARAPPTWRPSGSRTSARRPCCGSARRGEPVANAIVWQDTRTAALAARAGGGDGPGPPARDHRPPPLDLLLRPEGALAARRATRRCGRARRPASCCFGTIDSLADLAADRRRAGRRARHRRDEREPHAADGPAHARLVATRRSSLIGIPRAMLPEIRSSSEVYGELRGGTRARRRADRRRARRPAGRAVRTGLLRPRARRRTPTAPAASCSSTRARSRSPRASC